MKTLLIGLCLVLLNAPVDAAKMSKALLRAQCLVQCGVGKANRAVRHRCWKEGPNVACPVPGCPTTTTAPTAAVPTTSSTTVTNPLPTTTTAVHTTTTSTTLAGCDHVFKTYCGDLHLCASSFNPGVTFKGVMVCAAGADEFFWTSPAAPPPAAGFVSGDCQGRFDLDDSAAAAFTCATCCP